MRRLGLLGGTFDPIHFGHLDLGQAAIRALGLHELVVLVSNVPPHRAQPIASSHHRFAMVALAIAGRRGWRASDLELRTSGPSFTSDTLRRFHQDGWRPEELYFVLGADAFAEIETWKDYPAILDASHFAVVARPGHPVSALSSRLPALAERMRTTITSEARPLIFLIDAETADVSSTAIRHQLAEGRSLGGLVPPAVQQHIEQHQLYAPTRSAIDEVGEGRGAARPAAAGRLHGQER
jgi:nicotinate-nucleotide adenylyltransferase